MPAPTSHAVARLISKGRSCTPHRVDLRGPFRQWTRSPAPAAVLAREDLAAIRRAVHSLSLPWVEREREHGGLRLDAHVHAGPAGAAVGALVQRAHVALEIRAGCHPHGARITGHLADVATIRLSFLIHGVEPGARPVLALVLAVEQAGAADREDHSRAPAPDQHAVHVHGIVVQVLPVAHVLPVLAAVEAPDDPADLDRPVE